MPKPLFYKSSAWKLIKQVMLALLLPVVFAWRVSAQALPGVAVAADSVQDSNLQRYLQLSFDLSFNQPDKALHFGRKALTIARHLHKSDEEAKALENIGYIFYDRSALDSAEIFFSEAYKISRKTNNLKGQSDRLNALGQVNYQRQEYAKALQKYNQALKLLAQVEGATKASGIYNNISLVYKNVGNFPKAIENLLKALAVNEKADDKRRICLNLSNLGFLYKEMNNLPQALTTLNRSLAIAREIENNKQIVSALINLGLVHTKLADAGDTLQYGLAWRHLTEAATLSQTLKDRRNEAIAYHDLAQITLARKQLAQSKKLAEYSFKLKQEIGENQGLMHSYLQLANIAQESGRTQDAVLLAEKALTYANAYGTLVGKKQVLEVFARLLSASGNHQKAFQILALQQAVSDSLMDQEKAKSIAMAEIAYDTNKKQQAIARLEAEKQIQQQRIRYSVIIILFVLAGAVLLILLQREKLFIKEKENAVQQLRLDHAAFEEAHLKEKLDKYTRELIQSNEAVLQLQEQLASATGPVNTIMANKTELTSLKVLREEDWLHFKELFQTVYPSFLTILKTKYPGLSANDTRLAALFRLGLNTREMAGALGVEIESVKKARHRLRKKLACDSEQDLAEYFSSLEQN